MYVGSPSPTILELYVFSVKCSRVEEHFHFLSKALHLFHTLLCSVPLPTTSIFTRLFSFAFRYLNVLPHFQGDNVFLQEMF